MMTIEWSEPPPETQAKYTDRGRDPKQVAFADALRERPGEWAIFRRYSRRDTGNARSAASRISRGRSATFGEHFQAVARLTEDEKDTAIYVRYLPDRMLQS